MIFLNFTIIMSLFNIVIFNFMDYIDKEYLLLMLVVKNHTIVIYEVNKKIVSYLNKYHLMKLIFNQE
jgi:hypothetical protein